MPAKHRRDVRAGDGPRIERWVMATPAGEWSLPRLVLSLAWITLMCGLSLWSAYDDLLLNQRAVTVPAQVTRTSSDQRDPTYEAELLTRFAGARLLVEEVGRRPTVGDVVDLEIDPQKPTRVRDAESARWRLWDSVFVVLGPVGVAIAWARVNHWLRVARRPVRPGGG